MLMDVGIYSASKAALTMASETLHLEMMPFGVKVLTVNSGLIKSNLARNSLDLELPVDSLYQVINRDIAARARMEELAHLGTEPEIYAESIVRDVLASTDGTVWRGALASFLRYCQMMLPKFLLVSLLLHDCRFVVRERHLTHGAGENDGKGKRFKLDLNL